MKLYDLNPGDLFKLAGDDSSPIFTMTSIWGYEHVLVTDVDLNEHTFPGYTPVIRVNNSTVTWADSGTDNEEW